VSGAAGWLLLGVLAAAPAALVGCLSPQIRSQSADEADRDVKYDVETVGDAMSTFANTEPVPVGGVGLVVGLDGTGSTPPQDAYRQMLEKELQQDNVRNVKEVLASPDVSLVLVSATIPPGARKGDPLPVGVTLPPGSRTTSLRGGYLKACVLYDYAYQSELSRPFNDARYADSTKALRGHALARAEGALLVGLGDGDEAARLRQGRIWDGARCKFDRPFYLLLNKQHEYARIAGAVADRINEAFPGGPGSRMAVAKDKTLVVLQVPAQYRLNLPRFLRVVRMIPLREGPEAKDARQAAAPRPSYRHQLEEDVLNPAHTVSAALRLEALGARSVPALKAGLQSKHGVVRFATAEALAYLDSPAGGAVLAQAVEQHPALRAFSLTALASMDQAISHVKLRDLLASPHPETRYGAFRALRALDEHEPAVQGELLNDSFWLHRVAPESPSLVHLSSGRRAEVVLFGAEPALVPPFELLAGTGVKFTVTGGDGEEHRATVTRFDVGRAGPRRLTRQCSLRLEDVLRTLAGLGGSYAEAVELLRQANECQCVSCPVAVDQLPQAVSVEELARAGANDPDLQRFDGDAPDAAGDFAATPTLYQKEPGASSGGGAGKPRGADQGGKAVE
jgi:hypothetical protein